SERRRPFRPRRRGRRGRGAGQASCFGVVKQQFRPGPCRQTTRGCSGSRWWRREGFVRGIAYSITKTDPYAKVWIKPGQEFKTSVKKNGTKRWRKLCAVHH
ncbi:MAG: hypothetical protein BJ554DRAFT_3245, partial [Olpidium bornovanus]